jgi:hypothetical protein
MPLTAEQQARLDALEAKMDAPATAEPAASDALPTDEKSGADFVKAQAPANPPAAAPGAITLDGSAAPEESAAPSWKVDGQPGVLNHLMELAFPTKGVNPDYEKLPDWYSMPEMASFTMPAAKAGAGTLVTNAEETKKILEEQLPGVKIRHDGRYLVMKSGEDGKEYAWKPGVRTSDWIRAAAAAGLVAPVGLGAAALASAYPVAAAGLAGLSEATAHEAIQAGTGGRFDTDQALLGGAVGLGAGVVGKAFRGIKSLISGEAAPAAEAAAQAGSNADPEALKTLGKTMAQAARSPESAAAAKVAEQVKPDPEILAAAQRQGLLPNLNPDHVSTNDAFQQLAQVVKRTPVAGGVAKQSETDAIEAVGNRMKTILTDVGGETDLSKLNYEVKDAVQKQLAGNRALTKSLYDPVEKAIPGSTPVKPEKILSEIDRIAANRRGELPKWVAKIRAALLPNKDGAPPTWDILNAIKSQIGAATKGLGSFGTAAKGEPGLASDLYELITKDAMSVAESRMQGGAVDAARAASQVETAFKKDVANAFGLRGAKSLSSLADEGSMLGKMEGGVSALASGRPEPFSKLMQGVTEELRPKVAASSLFSTFLDGKAADLGKFADFWGRLKANSSSYNALMTYLPPTARQGLEDSYKIASAITNAMSKGRSISTRAVFPESNGFVGKVLGLAGAKGVPFAAILGKVLDGAEKPIVEALAEFLPSPAGRLALEHAASGAPLPVGRIASIASSPAFKKVMAAANVPVSASQSWLEQALAGAAIGSPARAQQPEEAK